MSVGFKWGVTPLDIIIITRWQAVVKRFFRIALKFFKALPSTERSFIAPLDYFIVPHFVEFVKRFSTRSLVFFVRSV